MSKALPHYFGTRRSVLGDGFIPRMDWDRPPYNRHTFINVREFVPTAEVWRGRGPVSVMSERRQNLDELPFTKPDGKQSTIGRFLADSFTDGFIVLHRGAIITERYFGGMTGRSLHLSQSVAKSITGTVAGILIGRGQFDPNAPITEYLPELDATAYRGATIQQVMDMTSGVRFDETYTDPCSDIGKVDVASNWKPVPPEAPADAIWPRDMREVILSLKTKEAEHGARYQYRSIETDVLAFAMQRSSGQRLSDLVSELLWQPMGAEESANFTVDPSGYALAEGGFNATLRDYARFGLVHLGNGHFNGHQIVPAAFVEDTRSGPHGHFNDSGRETLPNGCYRNTFWIVDRAKQVVQGRGVFGQLVHVDPHHDLVVVKLSSYPVFIDIDLTRETNAAIDAITAALS